MTSTLAQIGNPTLSACAELARSRMELAERHAEDARKFWSFVKEANPTVTLPQAAVFRALVDDFGEPEPVPTHPNRAWRRSRSQS